MSPTANTQDGPLGIIAGSGQFPALVASAARRRGRRVVIVGLAGNASPDLAREADVFQTVRVGQFGRLVDILQENGVREAAFAGAVSKPGAFDLRPDMRGLKLFLACRAKGDDAILRAVIGELEAEGITVRQAADLMDTDDLRVPEGCLTAREPSPEEWSDIRHGWPVARSMGAHDVGQCLAVKSGCVVAVEAIEGTDATIRRAGKLAGPGCTVIKMAKPGQDSRIDLPAVGTGTVRTLAEAGATCLAVSAGTTLMFDRDAAVSLADAKGIAIVAISADPDPQPVD